LRDHHLIQQGATVERPPLRPDERKLAALRRVWQEARPLTPNDAVLGYLYGRGIVLPPDDLPRSLRYHPHLRYQHDDGKVTFHPAMLALIHGPDGRPVSLHRTYLTADGRKAAVPSPKKIMSPAMPGQTSGGAMRLYQAGPILALSEGIETSLSAFLATGLPTWSTVSAAGMRAIVIPAEVHLVVICADADRPGTDAAKALARRLLDEGRRVKILTPTQPGHDWADCWERRHA
jgi:putative DNA primase/helicase